MTTKFKIISGFSLLLVLLGFMAFLGYTSLHTASENFNAYRVMARTNVYCSDLSTRIFEASSDINDYAQTKNPEDIAKALSSLDIALTLTGEIRQRVTLASAQEPLDKTEKMIQEMKRQLIVLRGNLEKLQDIYVKQNLPNMGKASEMITAMADGARTAQNMENLYYQTALWRHFGQIRELMAVFFAEIDPEAGQKMLEAFAVCKNTVQDMEQTLVTEKGVKDLAALRSAFMTVMDTVVPMVAMGKEARASITVVTTMGNDIQGLVDELHVIIDGQMRAGGEGTLQSNTSAQTQLLIISAIGLVLGIAAALLTIITMVRTLARMSAFASDIAAGNFDSPVRITEKGEIGTMFAAMRQIPEIFTGVLSRCNHVADDIASGLFRNRLEAAEFSGGFRDLALGINTIADSYTRTVDNLPVGIITLTPEHRTIFTNEVGKLMVGTDAAKAFGGNMPLLDESLRANRLASAESSLTSPDGKALHVAATVLPLHNLKGETIGGLEVLADVSEIKGKQHLMIQVAGEASTIANRVAAASEQLAAQVEQISRGADVQKSRVESTASAMTEMNSTVIEVAQNAGQAARQTEATRESAENGAGLVRQVVTAINEVDVIGNRLHGNMQELGDKAENIGGVMGVISDIADQTNLLALNAAIEAARAGEAGRGFAVVADEVRKLAEKTMNATREVGGNIEAIQQSTRANIEQVGHAVQSVGKATELANASGKALEEIVGLAGSSSQVVASIAAAAEEQGATSEEISGAIEEINHITGETASGMVQSSAAVQELSRMAQELRQVMQKLQ